MNRKTAGWIVLLMCIFIISRLSANENLWVTGYLPAYYQSPDGSIGFLTAADYQKVTHFSHHGPYVNPDGSFNYEATSFSDIKAKKAVTVAHQHGVPVLLCIVAWYDQYIEAINDSVSRNILLKNVLKLVDEADYDGVDVDLEPVMSAYIPAIVKGNPCYIQFVSQLYDSLQQRTSSLINRPLLLTAPMNGYAGPVFAQIHDKFDQINIMTYDMVAPDWGFPVWHDAAVYSGGYIIYGKPAPSIQGEVQLCLQAGVPAEKIGIGVSCDAFRWKGGTGTTTGGATAPRQQWQTRPSWTRFAYKDMMLTYFRSEYYRWDDVAKMSYLSIDREGSANDEFWSYNDEKSCEAKVEFIRANGLGGLIIWELGSGYLSLKPVGARLPQLSAIHDAIMQPSDVVINQTPTPLHFSLTQNYPNPFNGSTTIKYDLARDSYVYLAIYNMLGEEIETLVSEEQLSGNYTIVWPNQKSTEAKLSSGTYFYRINVGGIGMLRPMIFLK
ncbi:T9SS type A sorting domain-containing protein [candidate division KSB1 bacterium]|nr:T9SS type A sorting domain-containing protein [candidate division KSB1 bacterium]